METNAPSRTLRNQLARGQASLGEVRSRLGRGSEALRDVAAAVAIAKPAFENATGDLEQREVLADVYLAQGNVLARAGRATEARAAWTAASRLIDSVALATGETALLVSAATARLHLGDVTGATPTLHELLQRGYRGRGLLALAREKGAPIAP